MRRIVVCVLMLTLSLWTVQQGKALPWKQQRMSSSSQFPQYRLLQKTPHFEYRSYEPSTLMSTGVPVNSSVDDLFDKLTNLVGSYNKAIPISKIGARLMYVKTLRAIHGYPCDRPEYNRCDYNLDTDKLRCYVRNECNQRHYRDCSYEDMDISDMEGYRCVFPFRYRNVWYHACTGIGMQMRTLWCSHTKYLYDGTGEWGWCPAVRAISTEEELTELNVDYALPREAEAAVPVNSSVNALFDKLTNYQAGADFRENTPTGPKRVINTGNVTLPELNVAYVLPREMEAAALATTSGNDVTVASVPAGNICSRDLDTAGMTYEVILATASELVKHCKQAGHNHAKISLVKYLNKDEPRAEMWFM